MTSEATHNTAITMRAWSVMHTPQGHKTSRAAGLADADNHLAPRMPLLQIANRRRHVLQRVLAIDDRLDDAAAEQVREGREVVPRGADHHQTEFLAPDPRQH